MQGHSYRERVNTVGCVRAMEVFIVEEREEFFKLCQQKK
jgi:hypothetical protein